MKSLYAMTLALASFVAITAAVSPLGANARQEKPTVKIPEAGVPQVMTIEGLFVRAAYNNEGYAIIGYKTANMSVGDEWMLLEMGATLREGVSNYALKRDALSLDTPDGTKLPLASVDDYRKANLAALDNRAKVARDSINYFPPNAVQACRIGFFSDLSSPAMSWNEVELSSTRGCLGRLYFKVPGGIKYGQHWLNVQFEKSLVRVPFRILTKDEEKLASKNYKDLRKQVQEAFKPPKKT
ncbi:MAG: hypothetical protein ACJ731_04050 [Vicinamibacterales bacterium]